MQTEKLPVPEYYSAKEIAEVHNTYETAIYEIVKKVKISKNIHTRKSILEQERGG